MHRRGLPPWHMWGNSLVIATTGLSLETNQLVRIAYARPERWRWVFAAKEIVGDALGNFSNADVHFDLSVGVGRSVLQIPDFEFFKLPGSVALAGNPPPLIYSTQSRGPLREFADTTSGSILEDIVAQDIQLQVRIVADSACSVQVTALFSPATHVRPEWFVAPTDPESRTVDPFSGGEHEGK